MLENQGLREQISAFYKTFNRREFIDDAEVQAWNACDRPLSIGHGQTISQPSLVLAMTQELELEPSSRVLEIGTGSGFQTASPTKMLPKCQNGLSPPCNGPAERG